MNREEIINQIEKNISLYKTFTCPDFPDLNIYVSQYKDILVELFRHTENPYSLIYTDVNKLSVVNERYGKEIGDKTLYSLLLILLGRTSPLNKKSCTVRVGGDEFITFVPNTEKEQVQKYLSVINVSIDRQKDFLYGSSLALAVEDSRAGNFEQLVSLTEHQIHYQKHKNRKKDAFLTQVNNSKIFVELPIPENISEEQQEKWETLNTKINILVDNHLRDIRPSSDSFQYEVDHIQKDAKAFISSFGNLLEKTKEKETSSSLVSDSPKKPNLTYKSALAIHTLFQGKTVDFSEFDEKELTDLNSSLNYFCESLIRDKHSGLFSKSYYNMYLADKLLNSNKTWQAIYYSMSGIRPSNTAYGYSVTDEKIEKTAPLLINELHSRRTFNDTPFTFDNSDCFFVDQSGGNYIALLPTSLALSKEDIGEVENSINSHYTDGPDSTLKIASATYDRVNKRTIPFFVHSYENTSSPKLVEFIRNLYQVILHRTGKKPALEAPQSSYTKKPFVQFARRLKETCNNNKDPLKIEYLSSDVNRNSIEVISNDCIQYYLREIENADSIETKKFLIENVMMGLLNHENFVNRLNKQLLIKKQNDRKIFRPKKTNIDLSNLDERE